VSHEAFTRKGGGFYENPGFNIATVIETVPGHSLLRIGFNGCQCDPDCRVVDLLPGKRLYRPAQSYLKHYRRGKEAIMRAENIQSTEKNDKYLNAVLLLLGTVAVSAGTYVAWPALAYLGSKLI
jgi:hypothetical protein